MLAKRIIFNDEVIPDVSAADFDNPLQINLAVCQEAQGEGTTTDGTNINTVPLYSKFVGLKVNLMVRDSSGAANTVRWMLHKLPDGEELITDANRLTDTGFHANTDDSTFRELRKCTLAKGIAYPDANRGQTGLRVFIKRDALKRNSLMREDDVIRLDLAKAATGTTCTLSGFGTMYFRTT